VAQLFSLGVMHTHRPLSHEELAILVEKEIQVARSSYLKSIRLLCGFASLLLIPIICCFVFGLQPSFTVIRTTAKGWVRGGLQPMMIPIAIGGIGTYFQLLDFRDTRRAYRAALKKREGLG